jgi:translation initiation factor RLI1
VDSLIHTKHAPKLVQDMLKRADKKEMFDEVVEKLDLVNVLER